MGPSSRSAGLLSVASLAGSYAAFLLLALHSFHRSRCAAAIFLLPAADITGLGLAVAACVWLLFAHRAFCAVLIFLRAAGETARLGLVA